MSLFSVLGVCLLSCVLIVVVKQSKPELALPVSIASGCVILGTLIVGFAPIIGDIKNIMNYSGIGNEYIKIMLKALGISYLTQFAADTCNDFGQTALASKVELCGKIALATLTLPLIVSYLEILTGIMN